MRFIIEQYSCTNKSQGPKLEDITPPHSLCKIEETQFIFSCLSDKSLPFTVKNKRHLSMHGRHNYLFHMLGTYRQFHVILRVPTALMNSLHCYTNGCKKIRNCESHLESWDMVALNASYYLIANTMILVYMMKNSVWHWL